jgi:hypothetical protein
MRRAKATSTQQSGSRLGREIKGGDKFLRILALLCFTLVTASTLDAEQPKPSEYQVEAAYLLNFGKFVEWPAKVESSPEPFSICVLGQYQFGPSLEKIVAGESIDDRKVAVRRISTVQEAMSCRILFISLSEEKHLPEILKTLDKASVLTVSNASKFSRLGGMIQFAVDANKVRFEVNLASAERAGLTLSSQLLKVATTVTRNSQPGTD